METVESIVFAERTRSTTSKDEYEKVRRLLDQQLRRLNESRSCVERLSIAERIRGIAECAHALDVIPAAEFNSITAELRRL
jgi:hypothetical protein